MTIKFPTASQVASVLHDSSFGRPCSCLYLSLSLSLCSAVGHGLPPFCESLSQGLVLADGRADGEPAAGTSD
ncbi:hypothetical protein LY76DRAFT_413496 [Colletotrichum caudatum]|nr:hypothetical protein LY76DRAFT_413496 [Colletotrichum caudatum]